MITRRNFMTLLTGIATTGAVRLEASESDMPGHPQWDAWRAAHLTPEGRVVNVGAGRLSDSEGQGYGLVLAESFGDLGSFERILDWSISKLSGPQNNLLAGFRPSAMSVRGCEAGNVTFGDVLHAWALVRATESFGRPVYRLLARRIAVDIARFCLRGWPGRPGYAVLLPGSSGFEHPGGLVVNPGAICPRALNQVGKACGVRALEAVAADSVVLAAQLSYDTLPPDWIMLGEYGLAAAPGRSINYGYDALRLPLHLVWSGLSGHPAVQCAAMAYAPFIGMQGHAMPTVIDPQTGEILETSRDAGFRAIAMLTARHDLQDASQIPVFAPWQPSYSSTLHLLALVAQKEAGLGSWHS